MAAVEKSFPTSADAPHRSPALTHSPKLTFIVIAAGNLLSAVDLLIVNLAFSSIRDSFPGVSNQTLSWVLSAYAITLAACLVPSGRLADRYGRKRVFRLGLLTFGLSSLGCAFAPDVLTLVLMRALKGVGAALIIPTSLGLLLAAYPQERHKQMVGIWAAIGSVGAALGPTIGGFLVHLDWRLIFIVNLPIAFPAWWLSRGLVETETNGTKMPDLIGSAAFAAGIACIVAAISYANDWGSESLTLWFTLAFGIALLSLFVWRCFHVSVPALDLRVFRVASFTLATIGMACFYIGFAMTILGGTLFLTQVWHWDPMLAGGAFAIGPAMAGVMAIVGGRANIAPTFLTLIGCGLFVAAGLWWYFTLDQQSNYFYHYLPGLVMSGMAAGSAQTGFLSGGASSLSASEYATGTGILNTSRQIGGAIGVALLVALTGPAVEASQYKSAFLVIALSGVAAGLTSLALKKKKPIQ